MLSSLPSNVTANDGFYTTSTGQDPNRVYGLGMCVPGTEARSCSDCIMAASNGLVQNCTNQTEAIDWRMYRNTLCLVRYLNRSFYGSLGMDIIRDDYNTRDYQPNVTDFDRTWEALTIGLIENVSSENFAAGTRMLESSNTNIYGFMQCSRDISLQNCTRCLQENVIDYRSCCRGRQGAGDDISTSGSLQFDFKAIEAATSNFHNINKLGHGGFGEVYKETFPNGTEIAVKRLSKNSGQGDREFKNEVLLVAKLQHRNLVRLLGFCVQGEEKILVYELTGRCLRCADSTKRSQLNWTRRYKIIGGITRGILYLHQDSRLTIIHRDLKASNILLDVDMNPKIADFGMAKNFRMDQTEDNTGRVVGTFGYMPPEYVANGQFSTKSDVYSFGVLVLEIIGGKKNSSFHEIDGSTGNLVTYVSKLPHTLKFFYFVMNIALNFLVSWKTNKQVWRLWTNESLLELIDPDIGDNYNKYEVIRCIHIGLLCVQENPTDRPTMFTIFQMLTNTSITLHVPQPPGFFFGVRTEETPLAESTQPGPSTSMSIACSVNDVSITCISPR
ncbi:hypothetical protein Bca101_009454 [Brassica carinata]